MKKKVSFCSSLLLSVDPTNCKSCTLNLSSDLVQFSVGWICWQGKRWVWAEEILSVLKHFMYTEGLGQLLLLFNACKKLKNKSLKDYLELTVSSAFSLPL